MAGASISSADREAGKERERGRVREREREGEKERERGSPQRSTWWTLMRLRK